GCSCIRQDIMRALFYIIAIILLIGWALGTFVYAVGNLIYILLVLAIVALVLGLARRNIRKSQ
ncbi:MAG: lmo0937 family membrane protein, partial [Olivibacter sp.]|nr:lmo0937 family membrane protein [Olivibacter sp. UJ_SKK_5.1]